MFKSIQQWLIDKVLTSSDRGRIRTEPSHTGFWEGREFRLNEPIPTSGKVIRMTSTVNFELQSQQLLSNDDEIIMLAYRSTDGVEGGTWIPSNHYLPNNLMADTPSYTGVITVDVGGSFVPDNPLDYKERLVAKSASSTAQASSVGANASKERGLPPGVYYLLFTGGGEGDFNLIVEERP